MNSKQSSQQMLPGQASTHCPFLWSCEELKNSASSHLSAISLRGQKKIHRARFHLNAKRRLTHRLLSRFNFWNTCYSHSVANGAKRSTTDCIIKAFPSQSDKTFLFESMNHNIQKYQDPFMCVHSLLLLACMLNQPQSFKFSVQNKANAEWTV